MERERKFVVDRAPPGLRRHPHKRIRQGYLATSGRDGGGKVEVRVRDEEGKHSLTVKGGGGASRAEVELPLSADGFGTLWRLTSGKRIEKVRYRVPLGELTIELDVYGGKLRGLMTAEVEFDSAALM